MIDRLIGPVESAAAGRHPAVVNAARWLDVNPRLDDAQQQVARLFALAALGLLDEVQTDGPELTRALTSLLDAKDSAVRASLAVEERR